ncbi:RHS repeat-associated core domain-containing protein [Pseudomonas sp. p21]|uniref:RHS repeat-associated core domain-containing protein n=1 Tax=Pseudomonas sp. p21 TaxID=1825979 RepID=UPI0009EEA24D|nr:RHS repeat-associated core domain-containing protein [Pseudomonas sp. p21]
MNKSVGIAPSTLLFYAESKMICQLDARKMRMMYAGDCLSAQLQEATMLLQVEIANTVIAGMAGECVAPQSYTPYGFSPIRDLAPIVQFNGEWHDPRTGSYPLGQGHRSFSSKKGRFISPDQLSPFGKGGLNAYAYCAGDPVNHIDPSGRVNLRKLFGFTPKTGLTKGLREEKLSFLKKHIKSEHETKKANKSFGVGRMFGRVSDATLREIVPMYNKKGFERLDVQDVSRKMDDRALYYVKDDLYIEARNMHESFQRALVSNGFALSSIRNVVGPTSSSGAIVEEIRRTPGINDRRA